ncbi:MAG TPA: UPF0175 family protein [Longimicrobiaceae bacterium]|nr:UPF0175 family protein [Longimicrobiaceae bacterium]
MSVIIPDAILETTRLSAQEMKQEIAVMLFGQDKLTLAQAARLAEMDRVPFQHLVASRGMFMHYTVAEFQQDLATLRELGQL